MVRAPFHAFFMAKPWEDTLPYTHPVTITRIIPMSSATPEPALCIRASRAARYLTEMGRVWIRKKRLSALLLPAPISHGCAKTPFQLLSLYLDKWKV